MRDSKPEKIEDAEVVLHLEVEVSRQNRARFLDFCRRAFPIYESIGGNRMVLYEDRSAPGRFDEVGYYKSSADYERSEGAVKNDPIQSELIREWRALLKAPPRIAVYRRERIAESVKTKA